MADTCLFGVCEEPTYCRVFFGDGAADFQDYCRLHYEARRRGEPIWEPKAVA